MIRFDPKTFASWKEKHVYSIAISITNTGCAWHKIQIEEELNPHMDHIIKQDDLTISLMQEHLSLLEWSLVTWTGKKWILTSNKINTRCGCGSSFSIKSGNDIQDKITQMKLAMKEKKMVSTNKPFKKSSNEDFLKGFYFLQIAAYLSTRIWFLL